MEITTINTELVAKMFLAGAKNLDAKKEWINELNVFPVPDGDTGYKYVNDDHVGGKRGKCVGKTGDESAGKSYFIRFFKRSER